MCDQKARHFDQVTARLASCVDERVFAIVANSYGL